MSFLTCQQSNARSLHERLNNVRRNLRKSEGGRIVDELLVVRCGRNALQHAIERGECQVMPLVTITQCLSFHSDGPGTSWEESSRRQQKSRYGDRVAKESRLHESHNGPVSSMPPDQQLMGSIRVCNSVDGISKTTALLVCAPET